MLLSARADSTAAAFSLPCSGGGSPVGLGDDALFVSSLVDDLVGHLFDGRYELALEQPFLQLALNGVELLHSSTQRHQHAQHPVPAVPVLGLAQHILSGRVIAHAGREDVLVQMPVLPIEPPLRVRHDHLAVQAAHALRVRCVDGLEEVHQQVLFVCGHA